jgi:hypothetical protein
MADTAGRESAEALRVLKPIITKLLEDRREERDGQTP